MDLREAMLSEIAIGLGCKSGVGAEAIAALTRATLLDAPPFARAVLFTPARKSGESGLRAAAATLGLALVFLDDAELLARQDEFSARGAQPSRIARERTGFASVAEAAALMGGGPDARLILRRRAADGVTCAVAARASEVEP
jgi:cobalamin biosynthesis protein CbiG